MTRLISFLFLCLSASSFAFPGFLSQSPNFPAFRGIGNGEHCADFSGGWKGTCADPKGKITTDSMEILQSGCASIKTKELELFAGQSKSVSDSYRDGSTVSYLLSLDWNKDKTALIMHEVTLSKMAGASFTGDVAANMHLDEKRLIIDAEYTHGKKIIHCEYDKI